MDEFMHTTVPLFSFEKKSCSVTIQQANSHSHHECDKNNQECNLFASIPKQTKTKLKLVFMTRFTQLS